MKLEARSKKLLAITKSKAKMYEFAIDEEYHIDLPQDPRNLLIVTIGILGELSALESRSSNNDEYRLQLKSQLITVGQYFDALNLSKIDTDLSTYLKLVGAAAYYLADMPGSSLVLAKDLSYDVSELTPNYLEGVLIWLLKSDINTAWYHYEQSSIANELRLFVETFIGFFNYANNRDIFYKASLALRKVVYNTGNDREVLFVDVMVSLAIRKIDNSSLNCLPKYTNLDENTWRPALDKPNFMKEFWPAQKLLGEQGIFNGASAVVQMPTSAGKTKATELVVRSAFLSGRAKLVVIIAPFRALCREITSAFERAFDGEDVNLNELQDVTNINEDENNFINFLLGEVELESLHRNSIVVSTPEKFVYLLRHKPELASEIGLLVFDEGHQFDTGKRGVTYELLLTSLNEKVNTNTQKVLISAVMANAESIGDWLNGESGIEIQGSHCLPTIRNIAFVSWKTKLGQLHYIDQDNESEREYFVPRIIDQINLGIRGREQKDRLFPTKGDNSSMSAYLGVKLCHQGPVAIFCGAKSTVSSISELLVDYYNRGLSIPAPILSSDQVEISKVSYLARLHFGDNHIFPNSIALGILPHSANIPNGIRVSVEWAMENNKACLVVCTSTLAQGVNLPIKYLIISSTFQAGQEISARDFHNLIGRAGRAGYHTEGSIIFSDTEIYDKKSDYYKGWKWSRAIHLLDFKNAEDCLSSLKGLVEPFDFDNIEVDIINFISNPKEYRTECFNLSTQHNIDISSLLQQMDYKESLIQAIESYFLSYLKDNPEIDDSFFVKLAEQTLAFYLADQEERLLFISVFELIAKRVLNLDVSKFTYYGKALLGVEQLLEMEKWIDIHSFDLQLSDSAEELLVICWSLIELLSKNKLMNKLKPSNLLVEFASKWIAGTSYHSLFEFLNDNEAFYQANTQKRKIKIDHVIDFSHGTLGFDAMLFIGALADVLDGRGFDESVVENLRLLQSRLKLGLSNKLELWLYAKGYVDREICKIIALKLGENGVQTDQFDYRVLEIFRVEIEELLSKFPSYFSEIEVA